MHTMEVLDKLGVLIVRYSGRVDYPEIRRAFDELAHVPGFRPGLHVISDFRSCETPLSGTEVRQLADYAERTDAQWGHAKMVLLAANDVTFGLARMYATLTTNHKMMTRVFRNAQEADDWLGLGKNVEEMLVSSSTTE